MNVKLNWTDRNTNEHGHRIYRSSTPMDTQAMPLPVDELGPNATEWEDTDTPVDQEVYYIVSAVRGAEEVFSDEVMIDTTPSLSEIKKITVAPRDELLSNFTMYVNMEDFGEDFWGGLAHEDGSDIRVKTPDGADVPFDLIYCSRTAQVGELFIRHDVGLSGAIIDVHYGDSALSNVPADDPNGMHAVWADFHRVYIPSGETLRGGNLVDRVGLGGEVTVYNNSEGLLSTRLLPISDPLININQGVEFSDGFYYVSGSNLLRKYDSEWNLVAENANPVASVGGSTNHCGDPAVVGSIMYVPIEFYTTSDGGTFSDLHITLFHTDDLAFINAYDISEHNHEGSSIAFNPEDECLYISSYLDDTKIIKYNLDMIYQGDMILQGAIPNKQGLTFYDGHLWITSTPLSVQDRGVWRFNSLGSDMTRVATFSGEGSAEGISHDEGGLIILIDNSGSRVTRVLPNYITDGLLPDSSYFSDETVSHMGEWTIGVSTRLLVGASAQGLVSYTKRDSASNTDRATLGYNRTAVRWGLWNSSDSWLNATSEPTVDTSARIHATHVTTLQRDIFVNGILEASDVDVSERPTAGDAGLYIRASDVDGTQRTLGYTGFCYLYPGILSQDWIEAEYTNLYDRSSFYTIS